jgi:hypothetical membrane protein
MPRTYAGIAAPIVFFVLLVMSGASRPGYDPVRDTISELTQGRGGVIQQANFWVYGLVLALVIMPGFRRRMPAGMARLIACASLVAIALGCLGVASFAPEPSPVRSMSWSGWLHLVSAIVLVFGMIPVACLGFACAFWGDSRQRALAVASTLVAVTCAALLVGTLTAMGQGNSFVTARLGLIERVYVLLYLVWQSVASWKLGAAERPIRSVARDSE